MFKSIILAFRPKTLTAALIPCVAAALLAYNDTGYMSWSVLIYTLLASFCIQIGTNLVNDAIDFKKGADTAERIGPSRITQMGILTANQVMLLAGLFFLAAIGLGYTLVQIGGLPILIIGLISVAMGYSYTAGPFPLAYLGLGDLFVVIFFGWIAVMGSYFLHTNTLSLSSFIFGTQIGLHCAVLIAINNLRDVIGDSKVNKKTLAVRMGIEWAKKEIRFLIFFPFILNLYWIIQKEFLVAVITAVTIPLAIKLFKQIQNTEPSPIYNKFLAQSAALHLLFGITASIALILN